MKKTKLILVILLGLWQTTQAQVTDAIKGAAKASGSVAKSYSSSGGGDAAASGCANGCADMGCQILFAEFFVNMWDYHESLYRGNVERINSIEVEATAYSNLVEPYYGFRPRVRGNWGLFSTDFRVAMLYDQAPDGSFGGFHTKDWQILGLNLIALDEFNLRVGSGFMYQDFDQKSYWENTAMADVYFDRWQIGAEGRIASQTSGAAPRKELSLRVSRKIAERGHFSTHFIAQGVYNRYFNAVDTWLFGGGIALKIQ